MTVLAGDLLLVGLANLRDVARPAVVAGVGEEWDLHLRLQQQEFDVFCQVVDEPHDCLVTVAVSSHPLHHRVLVVGRQLVQTGPCLGNVLLKIAQF